MHFITKLIIILLISSSFTLKAAEFSTAKDDYKKQYSLGLYVLTDSSKADLNFKRYQDVASKYTKPGATIYCIVKNGPAAQAGIELFDRIVGIDDHQTFGFLFKNNNPIKVKYIKNEKLYEKIIKPKKISQLNFSSDLECTKEFARFECNKHFNFNRKISSIEKKFQWVKIYECLKNKGSKIIPFEQNIPNSWLMLDSFDFAFGYYLWENQDEEKLKYYLNNSKKIINQLEEYIKNDNPGEIDLKIASNKISNLVNNIVNFNTHVSDDRLKNNFKINNDQYGINKIKEKISKINNFNNEDNLNYLKSNYLNLKKASEFNFIKVHWKKAILNIDWNLKSNFQHSIIYFDYIHNFKDEEALVAISLLNDFEKKLIKFKKDKEAILALRQLYSELWTTTSASLYKSSNPNAQKILKTLIKKLEQNYSNYNNLKKEDQAYILKKDSLFLTSGYGVISNIASTFKDLETAIKYADLELKIYNSGDTYSEENKLNIYGNKFSYFAANGYIKDAINSYYDFKNSASKVYKTRNGIINLSTSLPNIIMLLYQLGFYEEAQDLVNFGKSNLTFDSKSQNEWYDQVLNDGFKLTEALLLKKQFNYPKAINILEKLYKKCIINSYDASVMYGCSAFAHLLELYYKTGNLKKFESIYQEKMGNSLTNESSNKIYKYATTYMPDQITGLFKDILDYYKKTGNLKKYNELANKSLKLTNNILSKEKILIKNQHLLSYLDVYEGLAQLGSYLVENNHPDGILILKKLNQKIIDLYSSESFNAPISTNTKAKKIISSYLTAATKTTDNKFLKDSYNLYQVLRNSLTSKDIKKALVKKSISNSKKYKLVKKYQDYELLLSSYYKKDEFILSGQNNINTNIFSKTDKDKVIKPDIISEELKKLSKEIKANFPEYENLTKPTPIKVKYIQEKLSKDDTILDYYLDNQHAYVFIITKDSFFIKKNNFSIKDQIRLQNRVRDSLNVNSEGKLDPFDSVASYEIYKSVFQFFEKFIINKKNIFIIPDGLLQNIPLNILIYNKEASCIICSNASWLMQKYNFTYLPSIDFIRYKNYQKKLDSNNFNKKYLGIGDPVLGTDNTDKDASRIEVAKLLNRGSSSFVANTKKIKNIYNKVEGSLEEIKTVSKHFDDKEVLLLLNKKANETILKAENLKIYKFIHFATHGEISGALKGYNEPFLVLSPPDIGTEKDDGLLTMTEIMQLDINSDIVILSACNTASGNQKNSEGFSGLARAFLFSGSKSVMVSNWYVETFSAKELIINFMDDVLKNKNTFSSSLKNTMTKFIKSNPKKSHPFYWGPFVVVGTI